MRIDGRLFTCAIYLSTPIPFSYPVLKLAIVAAHGLRGEITDGDDACATLHCFRCHGISLGRNIDGKLSGRENDISDHSIPRLSHGVGNCGESLSGSGVIDKWFSD